MITPPASTRPTNGHILAEWFVNSASVLLLTFAVTLFWCHLDNLKLTPPHDPLVGISLRLLFSVVGGIFAVVSLLCLGVRSHSLRVMLIAWLAINFHVYQAGLFHTGSRALRACFGYVAGSFGVSARALGILTQGAFLYLLVGSLLLIARFWLEKKNAGILARQVASGEMLKAFCPACGGHIVFSATNLGQQVPCPHCEASMALRRPDRLKMSCFFCQGHIEFPVYAIGTKMKCPHCKMDITLLEPK